MVCVCHLTAKYHFEKKQHCFECKISFCNRIEGFCPLCVCFWSVCRVLRAWGMLSENVCKVLRAYWQLDPKAETGRSDRCEKMFTLTKGSTSKKQQVAGKTCGGTQPPEDAQARGKLRKRGSSGQTQELSVKMCETQKPL